MTRYILTDIEGTTTPINFVHQVLFPYAKSRIAEFLQSNIALPDAEQSIAETEQTMQNEGAAASSIQEVSAQLIRWIDEDRKHPALKRLQGLIWAQGYADGSIRGQVYPDVPPAFRQWKKQGLSIGIYSSGSVLAQQLLFRHSTEGDLSGMLSHYFDTGIGGKKEESSYRAIANQLNLPPSEILFLSDSAEELAAASAVGMPVTQLLRGEIAPCREYPTARNFAEIDCQAL